LSLCQRLYFESEEEEGLRQYGHSKVSRPNPIVQMGLFTDMEGIPLAFCINPGNTTETKTLKPLEDKPPKQAGNYDVLVQSWQIEKSPNRLYSGMGT